MQIVKTQTDKLVVGSNDVSHPEGKDQSPTGTAVLNGPVYVGKTGASPNYEAVLNVTSNSAQQLPGDQQPACSASLAMKSDGNVVIDGDNKTIQALLVNGDVTIVGNTKQTGNTVQTGTIKASGSITASNFVGSVSTASGKSSGAKAFDIPHPSKEGHRLRHICLEGPETAVYHRGRLKESNVINLPDYWKDLVHEDSITVQLQPIGSNQNLVIQEFNNEFIIIAEDSTNTDLITDLSTIDCFYHVYGERKDVNPLLVEYEGNSRYDYPDPNFREDSDILTEDRNYRDPKYDFPRNTITS